MNHGGVENSRENEHELVSTRGGSNGFGCEMAKVAISHICKSVGFQGAKESALHSFTELAIVYLCRLGQTASFSANLPGRRECSVFDVVSGLEELGVSREFSGGPASSRTLKELIEYVSFGEEIEILYVQPVSEFPVMRNRNMIPSFIEMDETPPGKHIPDWLPALPDPHTYIHTPVWNERETDPRADKIEQASHRRKAERSLLSLQQRLASNGPMGTSPLAEPFPILPGVTNLSVIDLENKISDEATSEGHVSVLEAFAPVTEALEGGFSDDDSKCVLTKRAKKPVGEFLDLILKNRGERLVTWIARDDERHDKKRRIEYILRQSIENPQNLLQL